MSIRNTNKPYYYYFINFKKKKTQEQQMKEANKKEEIQFKEKNLKCPSFNGSLRGIGSTVL